MLFKAQHDGNGFDNLHESIRPMEKVGILLLTTGKQLAHLEDAFYIEVIITIMYHAKNVLAVRLL